MATKQSIYGQSIILNEKSVNEYVIVGTMSSGKSTFINSIIGFELFPSKISACTAKNFSYYGNPDINYFLFLNNTIKKPVQREKLVMSQIEKWNQDQRIAEIIIEGPVITHKENGFAIIDTPGPNNSMTKSHEETMKKALSKSYHSIIYVLNATQLGVDDDRNLLHFVREQVGLKKIIFIVNKADMIDDTEQENLYNFSENVTNYLKNNGFEKPSIYFVSSIAAMLAMKIQSKTALTRKESSTYWRLEETLKKNLAQYNINEKKPSFENTKSASLNNEVWNNSGIQSIINLL
ncbi:dynamin family protein [Planococcus sp. X10-3]|uniref:dynamin family protein n=1 Tax=Planococcus sp. X10-3 TaxID=3061240 RepID=UPI003BB1B380